MKPFYERREREARDIEKPLCAYAERRGWFVCKFVAPGLNGMPDRFLARRGRVILVEAKAPGKEPTEQQQLRHAELREHGVEVFWINSLEQAYDILR